mmetsp:Transcript_30206/g.54834  ORF Transcript_30206/g.54834 Transcript_30206/m.54834 type:complete len:139 (-) Transcript_30206:90-506(-)
MVTAFGMGGTVASDGKREASHHFTLGANLVLFGLLLWKVYGKGASSGSKPWTQRWGAFILCTLGCTLLMWDTVRHVLLDHGGVFFKIEDLVMYNHYGGLTPMGHISQSAAVFGFLMLLSGVLWFAGVLELCCGRRSDA